LGGNGEIGMIKGGTGKDKERKGRDKGKMEAVRVK
jgi:hypothetical protein